MPRRLHPFVSTAPAASAPLSGPEPTPRLSEHVKVLPEVRESLPQGLRAFDPIEVQARGRLPGQLLWDGRAHPMQHGVQRTVPLPAARTAGALGMQRGRHRNDPCRLLRQRAERSPRMHGQENGALSLSAARPRLGARALSALALLSVFGCSSHPALADDDGAVPACPSRRRRRSARLPEPGHRTASRGHGRRIVPWSFSVAAARGGRPRGRQRGDGRGMQRRRRGAGAGCSARRTARRIPSPAARVLAAPGGKAALVTVARAELHPTLESGALRARLLLGARGVEPARARGDSPAPGRPRPRAGRRRRGRARGLRNHTSPGSSGELRFLVEELVAIEPNVPAL